MTEVLERGVAPARPRAVGPALTVEGLSVGFGATEVLSEIALSWERGSIGAIIGPSGCGKTTLLRSLNRLVELAPNAWSSGRIALDGDDLLAQPIHEVRRRVGMVFQRPNPFPMSIFDNVAYALRSQASRRPLRRSLLRQVEHALVQAGLWDEVKGRLDRSALGLSGGQQQRLCIARVLAAGPEIVLMDEPCASLDPVATARIEELIRELRGDYTVIVVTHNLAQARRIAERTAVLMFGRLVEEGETQELFERPQSAETYDYVSGSFG